MVVVLCFSLGDEKIHTRRLSPHIEQKKTHNLSTNEWEIICDHKKIQLQTLLEFSVVFLCWLENQCGQIWISIHCQWFPSIPQVHAGTMGSNALQCPPHIISFQYLIGEFQNVKLHKTNWARTKAVQLSAPVVSYSSWLLFLRHINVLVVFFPPSLFMGFVL